MKLAPAHLLAAFVSLAAPALAAPGYLGVYLVEDPEGKDGALIEDVAPRSPAAKAGLRRGDLIVTFEDRPIANAAQLIPLLLKTEVGQTVSFTASRDDGWRKDFKLKLAERSEAGRAPRPARQPRRPRERPAAPTPIVPQPKERGFLGIFLRQGEGNEAIIDGVLDGSPAAKARAGEHSGLQVGDQIVSVDGKPATDPSTCITLLSQHGPGEVAKILVRRGGAELTFEVTLGRRPPEERLPPASEQPVQPKPAPAPAAGRKPFLGAALRDSDGKGPLVVDGVRANGPAERFGLRAKDVVLEVDGAAVKTIEEFVKAMDGKQAGQRVVFKIEREGWESKVHVVLGAQPEE